MFVGVRVVELVQIDHHLMKVFEFGWGLSSLGQIRDELGQVVFTKCQPFLVRKGSKVVVISDQPRAPAKEKDFVINKCSPACFIVSACQGEDKM